MRDKEFEVRAKWSGGQIFRVVRSESAAKVKTWFQALCYTSVEVQEVPLSDHWSIICL